MRGGRGPASDLGGGDLVPAREILATWRACRRRPLGIGDFRTWLACREMVARRSAGDPGRSSRYDFSELSRLTGVSEKRARAALPSGGDVVRRPDRWIPRSTRHAGWAC
jgi:hypothetical protein